MAPTIFLLLAIICSSFASIIPKTRHIPVVDLKEENSSFRGNLHVNGNSYNLNLQRAEKSAFARGFSLTETTVGPSGEIVVTDVTPALHCPTLERNIFVDSDSHAVFHMTTQNDSIQMHGVVKNIHISHDGEEHFAVIHDYSTLKVSTEDVEDDEPFQLTYTNSSKNNRGTSTANPEVFFTVDQALWKSLGEDDSAVCTYLAITMHGVNIRYESMDDPSIKFKIVGATIFKDKSAQPFIEASKNKTTGGDAKMSIATLGFKKYMGANDKEFPAHDLAPLLSGLSYDMDGLATTPGVCRLQETVEGWVSYKTSITADEHGVYKAIHILAHELGHSMGAPHDANYKRKTIPPGTDTSDCPWKDGYIMSYIWDSVNQYKFSKCSKRNIKAVIDSDQGKCAHEDNAAGAWKETADEPGTKFSMDQQCARLVPVLTRGKACADFSAKADATLSPEESCERLTCLCPETTQFKTEYPVLNGTPCREDKSGVCREGKCV